MRPSSILKIVGTVSILILFFQNCGQPYHAINSSSLSSTAQGSSFQSVFSNIIQPKCVACHSGATPDGGVDLSSYDAIMSSGSVVAGNKATSTFYIEVSNKTMPTSFPLTDAEIDFIGEWIDMGAQDGTGVIPNQPPVVNAGVDVTITQPTNSVVLAATAMDSDGAIALIEWTQVAGPATANFSNANSLNTTLSGLVVGTYTINLTVTDDMGAEASDMVVITVNAQVNVLPVVNAGIDQSITLPVSTATLVGMATDSDGNVASTLWTQTVGPVTAVIATANALQTVVSNMTTAGTYEFKLEATDNLGGKSNDTVKITVNAQGNMVPVANAGPDRNIQLPVSSIAITGTGVDPDGTVVAFAWKQNAGPSNATLTGQNTANLSASNLVAGTYTFQLTVTDDKGATGSDTMNVVVAPAAVVPTYTQVSQTILAPKCVGCHSAGNAKAGYAYDSYQATLKSVVVSNAAASLLYTCVADNSMPKGAPLTQAEKDRIKDWINAGAKNN